VDVEKIREIIRAEQRSCISSKARDTLEESVFYLLDSDNKTPIGVVFFVAPTVAVTCAHNLLANVDTYKVGRLTPKPSFRTLQKIHYDPKLDLAFLKSKVAVKVFLSFTTEPVKAGEFAALAGFNIGVKEELNEDEYRFKNTLSIASANINQVVLRARELSLALSPAPPCLLFLQKQVSERHLVYQSLSFVGHSGSALVFRDGSVVAMHLEGLNSAKERNRQLVDTEEKLDDVAESVDGLIKNLTQGQIGLLGSVIVKKMKELKLGAPWCFAERLMCVVEQLQCDLPFPSLLIGPAAPGCADEAMDST
jgi:hypothetical protein